MDMMERFSVLCIDDDKDILEMEELILTQQGYSVLSAASGEQGLLLAEQQKPDLILLDLVMPDMSGWDVYLTLKNVEPSNSIPIIIVSAKSQKIDRIFAEQIAMVDRYLTKPFSAQELLQVVGEALNR